MLDEVLLGITSLVRSLGLGEGYGLIYAHLLLSEKPLTVKELAERTRYSPSAVAMYLNVLYRADLVERRKRGNSYAYIAKKNYLGKYKELLRRILERDLTPLIDKLGKLVEKTNSDVRKKHLKEILDELSRTKKFIEKSLEIQV
ncbi:MAG: ArsR family transcriptional regulator [Candidatus Njordarchaeia archaeon]|nr:ArsR family transcriptional regulator [Candidatus Korarchaeota archaeon]